MMAGPQGTLSTLTQKGKTKVGKKTKKVSEVEQRLLHRYVHWPNPNPHFLADPRI